MRPDVGRCCAMCGTAIASGAISRHRGSAMSGTELAMRPDMGRAESGTEISRTGPGGRGGRGGDRAQERSARARAGTSLPRQASQHQLCSLAAD
eukprot:2884395-Rhodomonas_salina.1